MLSFVKIWKRLFQSVWHMTYVSYDHWSDSLPLSCRRLTGDSSWFKVTNLPHIARNRFVNQSQYEERNDGLTLVLKNERKNAVGQLHIKLPERKKFRVFANRDQLSMLILTVNNRWLRLLLAGLLYKIAQLFTMNYNFSCFLFLEYLWQNGYETKSSSDWSLRILHLWKPKKAEIEPDVESYCFEVDIRLKKQYCLKICCNSFEILLLVSETHIKLILIGCLWNSYGCFVTFCRRAENK